MGRRGILTLTSGDGQEIVDSIPFLPAKSVYLETKSCENRPQSLSQRRKRPEKGGSNCDIPPPTSSVSSP